MNWNEIYIGLILQPVCLEGLIRKAVVTHFNKRLLDYTKLNLNICVLNYILWGQLG
jgi:hypothetical protein